MAEMKRRYWLFGLFLLMNGVPYAGTGIMTDGSVGSNGYLGQAQVLAPSHTTPQVILIPASAGSLSGKNLFHSFDRFNIARGQNVIFEDIQNNFLENVIARVTGGTASSIDGKLTVTPGGHANFYLINPSGVLFGNGAQIDVPGDFHVSTANYVKFQDGSRFGSEPIGSKLSAAAPSSFGFAASNPHNNVLIQVSDGARLSTTKDNTAIDLVGPNIRIENGASLEALTNHSEIRLVAAKAGLDVSVLKNADGYLNLPNVKPSYTHAGNIEIKDHSGLVSESDGSGRIGEWAHNLRISDQSFIRSINTGNHDATKTSGIEAINQNITISDDAVENESSGLTTLAKSDGSGGNIQVSARGSVKIAGNSGITSISQGHGQGGSISLNSGSLDIHNPGNSTQSGIYSYSRSDSVAGSMDIAVRNSFNILGSSRIGTYAKNANPYETGGDTGNISVSAKNILMKDREGYQPGEVTGFVISQGNHEGRGGNISVTTRENLTIKGHYNYNGTPLSQPKHITGMLYDSVSTQQSGLINIKSGGYISLAGKGSYNFRNGSGEYAFSDSSAFPGIFISGRDDDSHLGDVSIYANKGISLENSAFLSQSNAHFPNISVRSDGPLSMSHSDIEYYLMNIRPDIGRDSSLSVSANGILMINNSAIHGSAPNSTISVLSKGDIIVLGTPLIQKDSLGNGILDKSIFYHGLYGHGGIQLKASGTVFLSNTILGGKASVDSGVKSDLHINLSSENLVLNNAALLLKSELDQLDIKDSKININTEALFPLKNSLNKGFYTSGIGVIYFPGFATPPHQNNLIQEKSSTSLDPNFELSGSLFGISGILPTNDMPSFESDDFYSLCVTEKNGLLSIDGKGSIKRQVGDLWH